MTNGTNNIAAGDPCSGDSALSTLSEINRELEMRMFELLNYLAPNLWTDPTHIVYSPRDDLDYASNIYQMRYPNSTGSIQLPFAYFSRSTTEVVERTYDQALRPWCPWLSTHPGELQSDWEVKVVPAIFLYVLRMYDSRVENTEMYFDALYRKGIREKSTAYSYESPILHIISPYRIELGNPRYDRVPTLPDRLKGKGILLSILLPFECRCILGESELTKRIEKINLKYREPICPPYHLLEGIVIDSNTPVKDDRHYLLSTEQGHSIITEDRALVETSK